VTCKLRTLDTQLRVDAIVPIGYDSVGLAVVLVPANERTVALARERRAASGRKSLSALPALSWHHTSAGAPGGETWGIDLRHQEPQSERRDSIVWLSVATTLDALGGAIVRGGATGPGLVQVQDPFDKGSWETGELRDFAPLDATSVAPPVARLDVRAFDTEGPLAGGKAHVDWLRGRRALRSDREARIATGAQPSGFEADAMLDAAGCAALFVPSLEALTVSVLDRGGARSAVRRLNAPGPAGAFSVTLTFDPREPASPVDGAGKSGRAGR